MGCIPVKHTVLFLLAHTMARALVKDHKQLPEDVGLGKLSLRFRTV